MVIFNFVIIRRFVTFLAGTGTLLATLFLLCLLCGERRSCLMFLCGANTECFSFLKKKFVGVGGFEQKPDAC